MEDGARRHFRFLECLGRGGFGEVYRAAVSSPGGLESTAVLKVLRSDLAIDADAVRRLRDEGRLLARLNHPTILKVFDLVQVDGRVALVAEYVDGADLAELVPDGMPVRALLQVIGAVAAALHAAWSTPGPDGQPLKLVHRDIKPTNIRVGRHGEVKLLDFGIAHFQGEEREARTESDVIVGSLPYMAPERFLEREVRPASDVFALGCTLFEGLVGDRFFSEGQLRKLGALALDQELYDEFLAERLALLGPEVPEPAAELLVEMLAHRHTTRPTAADVAARCDRMAEDLAGATLRRWCRERAWHVGSKHDGSLVGREVTEGTFELAEAARPLSDAAAGPIVRRAPSMTIDPYAGPALAAGPPAEPSADGAVGVIVPVDERPRRTGVFAVAGCSLAGVAILLAVSGLAAFIAILALVARS